MQRGIVLSLVALLTSISGKALATPPDISNVHLGSAGTCWIPAQWTTATQAAYDPVNEKLVIVGGVALDAIAQMGTWELDLTTGAVTFKGSDMSGMPSWGLPALAFDGEHIISFGGGYVVEDEAEVTRAWIDGRWQVISVPCMDPMSPCDWASDSCQPTWRTEALIAQDFSSGKVILYGGYDVWASEMYDTWSWDPAERRWRLRDASVTEVSRPKLFFAAGKLVLTGYDDNDSYLPKFFVWDDTNSEWDEAGASNIDPLYLECVSVQTSTGADIPVMMRNYDNGDFYALEGSGTLMDPFSWSGPTGPLFGYSEAIRNDCQMVQIDNSMWVFNDFYAGYPFASENLEMFTYSTAGGGTFGPVTRPVIDGPGQVLPVERAEHGAAFDERVSGGTAGRTVMFGGLGFTNYTTQGNLNDTWAFDASTRAWEKVATGSEAGGPDPRAAHAMAWDGYTVIMFGGRMEGAGSCDVTDEMWAWDGTEWTEIEKPGEGQWPSARWGHTLCYDRARGKVILFGGETKLVPSYPEDSCHSLESTLNDVWEWDGYTQEWTELAPTVCEDGDLPETRRSHGMCYVEPSGEDLYGHFLLFGGKAKYYIGLDPALHDKADLWKLTFTGVGQPEWCLVQDGYPGPPAEWPAGHPNHTFSYDPVAKLAILIEHDTSEHRPNNTLTDPISTQSTFFWDGSAWSSWLVGTDRLTAASQTFDRVHEQTIFFGGYTGFNNDIFSVSNGTFVLGFPPPIEAPAKIYASATCNDHATVLRYPFAVNDFDSFRWEVDTGSWSPVNSWWVDKGKTAQVARDLVLYGCLADRIGSYRLVVNNNTAEAILYDVRSTCPADLNGDNLVDDADGVLLSTAYNLLDCLDPAMPFGCPADFNCDGIVDDGDFSIFVAAYNELLCP